MYIALYYYEVVVPQALPKKLIYSFDQLLTPGALVQVPLRNKLVFAVVLQKIAKPTVSFSIRLISVLKKEHRPLSSARLKWLTWISKYYQYNLGPVVHLSFPSFLLGELKKQKKNIKSETNVVKTPPSPPPVLTEEQEKCVKDIQSHPAGFRVHLIHGVTGSGKTEIYFRLAAVALKQNKSILILVPEIALTPQHIKKFSLRFPNQVASSHSGMTPKEKQQQWTEVLNGGKKIFIGPRSVLFCPLPELGLIILDEEHEMQFKQEDKLRYHARDCAVVLAQHLNIPIVLGSATPSVESWWNAQNGKYHYHVLNKRAMGTSLPQLELVDMRKELKHTSELRPWWMSAKLYESMKETMKQEKQTALFLNRRGETGCVFCKACGLQFNCPNCDISLTQHHGNHLICHYCAWRKEKPENCPQCESELSSFGLGTQALQKDIENLFPSARIMRADRDEIRSHKEWEECITKIEDKEIDILIGTQMIAKSLDFPSLALVGIVLADQGWNRPDFRASEKSFQMITQMAGRAGRRTERGRVIVQTYNPEHSVIKALINMDYQQFIEQELEERKKYFYPPFSKLVLISAQGLHSQRVLEASIRIKDKIKNTSNLDILGPAPAFLFRLKNKYRYHLLIKSSDHAALNRVGKQIASVASLPAGVQIHINCDPLNFV